jgi:hypothetical protein
MLILEGPYCLVCGGKRVERRRVWGVSAWTSEGPQYGWVERDVCLDCGAGDIRDSRTTHHVKEAIDG